MDTSIAELYLLLGAEYTGQKVPPVLTEARTSGQAVQASIEKCKRIGAERNDE